jgi:hypothetical protein
VLNGTEPYLLNVTMLVTDITPGVDSATKAVHDRVLRPYYTSGPGSTLEVGECFCDPPSVDWVASQSTVVVTVNGTNEYVNKTVPVNVTCATGDMIIGGRTSVSVTVRQRCSRFCEYGLVYKTSRPAASGFRLSAALNVENASFAAALGMSFYPPRFSLATGASRTLTAYITSNPNVLTRDASVFAGSPEHTFNVSLAVQDTRNATATRSTALVTVKNKCVLRAPTLSLAAGNPPSISTGRSRTLTFPLKITNNDDPSNDCTEFYSSNSAHFQFSVNWGSAPPIWLAPNETGFVNATITTGLNLQPANYTLRVSVSNSITGSGYQSRTVPFVVEVRCPPPRAVSRLAARAIVPFFSFGLQAGPVFVSWEACSYGLWCCCPCSWRVERNGELLGVTTSMNFTDSSTIVVGTQYVYTVTTIDKLGAESLATSCDNFVSLELQPPSLKSFYTWLAATAGSMVGVALLARYIAFLVYAWPQLKRNEPVRYGAPTAFIILCAIGRFFKTVFSWLWRRCCVPCGRLSSRCCCGCFRSCTHGASRVRRGAHWLWLRIRGSCQVHPDSSAAGQSDSEEELFSE